MHSVEHAETEDVHPDERKQGAHGQVPHTGPPPRRVQLLGREEGTVSRSTLFDVEAPEYPDEARACMTPRAAMQAALRAETKAHAFFVAALPQVRDAQVRALLEELRDEEVVHQDLVQKELAKLPPEDEMPPDAFADEPTAL